jgi:uncharacterized protein
MSLLRTILAFVLLCFGANLALAKRVALVIGNSTYAEVGELNNPHADAVALAKALKDAAFDDVKLVENLNFEQMRRELKDFSNLAAGADIAVIYYAGHGVEMPEQNYLIPVDAKLLRSTDIEFEAITLASVRSAVSGATKLRMVVLDACRNNPFKLASNDGKKRAANRGLAAVEPGASEFIAYSAKEGTLAQDGPPKGNSPFATALLKSLSRPGVDIRLMFGQVRDDVLAATGREQEPYTYNSLGGEAIYLVPPTPAPVLAAAPVANAAAEEWALVQNSSSQAVLEAFRDKYGSDPLYRSLVEEKLALLKGPLIALPKTIAPNPPKTDVSIGNPATIEVPKAKPFEKPKKQVKEAADLPRVSPTLSEEKKRVRVRKAATSPEVKDLVKVRKPRQQKPKLKQKSDCVSFEGETFCN